MKFEIVQLNTHKLVSTDLSWWLAGKDTSLSKDLEYGVLSLDKQKWILPFELKDETLKHVPVVGCWVSGLDFDYNSTSIDERNQNKVESVWNSRFVW